MCFIFISGEPGEDLVRVMRGERVRGESVGEGEREGERERECEGELGYRKEVWSAAQFGRDEDMRRG